MKYLKLIVPVIALTLLVSCSKSSFLDLSVFLYNYNKCSTSNITLEDFTFEIQSQGIKYSLFIDELLLDITCNEENKISEVKALIAKTDENGKAIVFTEKEKALFYETLTYCIMSFCCYSEDEAQKLLNEFSLNNTDTLNSTGELSKNTDMFRFVYYSTELMSEMMISNTVLKPTESTSKPESKPYFAEITSIRTETVPLN